MANSNIVIFLGLTLLSHIKDGGIWRFRGVSAVAAGYGHSPLQLHLGHPMIKNVAVA
jgi:hypothetical protein